VEARTHDGRSLRLLVMIDEFTRECLAIRVARRLNSARVIELLGDCMNGAEMMARRMKQWLASVGTKRCSSSREVRGRTDTANPLMGNCGTSV